MFYQVYISAINFNVRIGTCLVQIVELAPVRPTHHCYSTMCMARIHPVARPDGRVTPAVHDGGPEVVLFDAGALRGSVVPTCEGVELDESDAAGPDSGPALDQQLRRPQVQDRGVCHRGGGRRVNGI